MDKLNVNTIEPEGGTTTINVGKAGKNVIITDNLKANTLKDAGGNTIFTSNGSGVLSSVNSAFGSAQVLLSTQTADDDASVSFTSGIDSTYKEYVFEFITLHSASPQGMLLVNFSSDGGSNYNVTKTTTAFRARHDEGDTTTSLAYSTGDDLAQSTSAQTLTGAEVGDQNDECCVGEMHLFNPSSTTYTKNFYSMAQLTYDEWSYQMFVGGYCNTTSAVNAVQFSLNSTNIESGKIKMYGIK